MWLPLLGCAAVALAWRGGYGQDARSLIAALAGVAVLAALLWTPSAAAAAARSPVVLALTALALVSALSAAWTIGARSDAIRDGAAILALAAVIVAAAALRPARVHAAVLLVAALAIAVVGLAAAITGSDPLALNICGTWRPAGPFQYPPTLGLVCAGALPVALALAADRRRPVAVGGASVAWVLGAAVALTANRTAVGLAGAALVAAVWLAPRRTELAGLAVALIAGAAGTAVVVGTHVGDAGAGRLLAGAAFVALPCLVAARAPRLALARPVSVALVALAALGAVTASVMADSGSGCQGDASHGRVGIWRAAVATAGDRPVQGFGSGTFLAASRDHQLEHRPRPTRFAHNLPLEAWVELGLAGLALVLAWYAALARELIRAVRRSPDAYLLAPFAAAFPLANVLDWPWHLLGAGVLWAVVVGGLIVRSDDR